MQVYRRGPGRSIAVPRPLGKAESPGYNAAVLGAGRCLDLLTSPLLPTMLYGKRVVLRAIEKEHLPNYVRWLADPEVLTHFGLYLPLSQADEEAWYERQRSDAKVINFAIELEGVHIGGCGFLSIDHRQRRAEVGLFIGEKQFWNQGLGQDALATLVAYGFEYLNFHRIYLCVFAENTRGIRAYEKVGFQHEGCFRQSEWRHGRWHDLLVMSILHPEWPGRGTDADE